ncbi:MAG: WG repeat-containing protein [Candidatus Dadabacteria bacterium]|nr:WG repeat-containing protein [Candidatus Dadabacteria bacterium]NIS08306.1 WG repeat-containing protein [Candidatus Dadabacteria bacterium]NIV41654.1 hypothetical protein [Candidatus Dadabacteria bacterium]NIY21825.1 hypothetical protein [Candidatus Dadabacteria bacterium]
MKGEIVIEPQVESVYPFINGMAAVQVAGLWGYLDKKRQHYYRTTI